MKTTRPDNKFRIVYEDYVTGSHDIIANDYNINNWNLNLILMYKWFVQTSPTDKIYLGSSYCDYLANMEDFLILHPNEQNKDYIGILKKIFQKVTGHKANITRGIKIR